jgi:hypothetical protein
MAVWDSARIIGWATDTSKCSNAIIHEIFLNEDIGYVNCWGTQVGASGGLPTEEEKYEIYNEALVDTLKVFIGYADVKGELTWVQLERVYVGLPEEGGVIQYIKPGWTSGIYWIAPGVEIYDPIYDVGTMFTGSGCTVENPGPYPCWDTSFWTAGHEYQGYRIVGLDNKIYLEFEIQYMGLTETIRNACNSVYRANTDALLHPELVKNCGLVVYGPVLELPEP